MGSRQGDTGESAGERVGIAKHAGTARSRIQPAHGGKVYERAAPNPRVRIVQAALNELKTFARLRTGELRTGIERCDAHLRLWIRKKPRGHGQNLNVGSFTEYPYKLRPRSRIEGAVGDAGDTGRRHRANQFDQVGFLPGAGCFQSHPRQGR